MRITGERVDEWLQEYGKAEGVLGENGRLKPLTQARVERTQQAEQTQHLGYEK